MPPYPRSRITTVPEFLEPRFDVRSRKHFSAVTVLLSILIDTAGGLQAGAVVLETFFPEIVIGQVCMGLGLFAGLYAVAGGLAAVVRTDVRQAVLLLLGTTLMALPMIAGVDWSWSNMVASAPDEQHLSMIRSMDGKLLLWPRLIVGVSLLGFRYWVADQHIVQRVPGAKDIGNTQRGAQLGGFLKILPLFATVLPGAMAIILVPDLPDAHIVFPTLVTTMLPVGVTGLAFAGLIAAITSSGGLDAQLGLDAGGAGRGTLRAGPARRLAGAPHHQRRHHGGGLGRHHGLLLAARPGAFGRRGRAHRVAPRHGLRGRAGHGPGAPRRRGPPERRGGGHGEGAPWHASIVTLPPLLLAARGAILIGVWQVATASGRAGPLSRSPAPPRGRTPLRW